MEAYYERRAAEYDDWYLGRGRFAERDRPGFRREVADVAALLSSLRPARTLDIGCGTGFMTRHLPGRVTALDRSLGMLTVARSRLLAPLVAGDALRLPFRDASFDRVFAGHVYGHLTSEHARSVLDEVDRVAPELVVLDAALRPGTGSEEIQERVLNDGSVHAVYKRFFAPKDLIMELGGGTALYRGRWFVIVRAARRSA